MSVNVLGMAQAKDMLDKAEDYQDSYQMKADSTTIDTKREVWQSNKLWTLS